MVEIARPPIPEEELAAILEELAEESAPRDRSRNVTAALVSLGFERPTARVGGRTYELEPVHFELGLRLVRIRQELQGLGRLADEELEEPDVPRRYRAALEAIARIAWRQLRPVGFVHRIRWRLRLERNPFRKATEAELGQLLGFFLACRTRSRVDFPGV